MQLLEIILDALPEALGGIITAGILGALALLINKWRSGEKIKTDNILHNLPRPDYEKFIGRQDKLQYIVDKLIGRPYLISIDGVGGIGKSALAIEIGHRFLNMTITTQGKPLQKKNIITM